MNKAELISTIAHATGHSKLAVHNALAATFHELTCALTKGERVTLVGFGTFERRHRQARIGVNPQNPTQKLKIPASRVPAFKAGQELKNIVNGKSKLPALSFPRPAKSASKAKKKSGGKSKHKSGKKRR